MKSIPPLIKFNVELRVGTGVDVSVCHTVFVQRSNGLDNQNKIVADSMNHENPQPTVVLVRKNLEVGNQLKYTEDKFANFLVKLYLVFNI